MHDTRNPVAVAFRCVIIEMEAVGITFLFHQIPLRRFVSTPVRFGSFSLSLHLSRANGKKVRMSTIDLLPSFIIRDGTAWDGFDGIKSSWPGSDVIIKH